MKRYRVDTPRILYSIILSIVTGILILAMCGCETGRKSKSGRWQAVRRADWEARFYDVFFIDENTGWTVGNNDGSSLSEELESTIAHTTDGGATWEPQSSGVFEHPLRKIHFVDALTGWIAGGNGIVIHTKNGGKDWERQRTNTFNDLIDIQFLTPREGWAVGDWGTALHTLDGGTTWTKRGLGLGERDSLWGVYFLDRKHGWIVSQGSSIYHTRDGGETWDWQKSPVGYALSDVHFVNRTTGWIIGDRRTILKTEDGGQTWNYLTQGSNKRHLTVYGQPERMERVPLHSFLLYDLCFVDENNGWIVGDLGVVLYTRDGGMTWKHQRGGHRFHVGGDNVLLGVHFVNNKVGWTVGESGTIFKTTNSGATWQLQASQSYLLYDLYFASDKIGYAVGDRGEILYTKNGGRDWESQDSRTTECFGGTHFINEKVGWAVAEFGTVLHTKTAVRLGCRRSQTLHISFWASSS